MERGQTFIDNSFIWGVDIIRSMTLNEQATREVLAVIDEYVRYYNGKNQAKVLSLFSKNISGFGTGKDEIVGNFAEFKERLGVDLNPANAIRIRMAVNAMGGEMPVAWVAGVCAFSGSMGGKRINIHGRMTAVLVNRGGRWSFEQVHFSAPDV